MSCLRLVINLLFVGAVIAGVSETIYTATLTPNQVAGAYVSDNNGPSFGTSFCRIQRYTYSMSCYLQHNVGELVNATLSFGPRGEQGTPLAIISIRSGFSLQFQYDIPSAEELQNILDGLYYIELYSLDYPDGEIRGQIEHRDRFYAYMLPQNTIPTSTGTDAHGIVVASYDAKSRKLDLDIVHDVTSALSTDFGIGQIGMKGSIDASLPGTSPYFPVMTLTVGEDSVAAIDLTFLNIRSQNNPQGDIRGQLISIDYIRDAAFTSVLVGASSAIGTGIFTFDCDTNILQYVIFHTVENATSSTIYEIENNVPLFILSSGQSPIYGQIFMRDDEAAALYEGLLGVSILNNSNSTGEILGPINDNYDYYSYLSGTNVVPAVTTHYGGIILYTVEDSEDPNFEYQMIHTVKRPSEIAVLVGYEGENSIYTSKYILESPFSPSSGEIPLDSQLVDALDANSLYIEVRTTANPYGILRGQIRKLNRCDLNAGTFSVGIDETLSNTSIFSYLSGLIQYMSSQAEQSSASLPVPSIFITLFMLLSTQLLF